MLKVDFTNEIVFGFEGPNLCLLGNEEDFLSLSKSVIDLTAVSGGYIEVLNLEFVSSVGENMEIIFASQTGAKSLGIFGINGQLVFELDPRYWERLFKYFVLMSWNKSTYYLNEYENYLDDFKLNQECNFICSSEF